MRGARGEPATPPEDMSKDGTSSRDREVDTVEKKVTRHERVLQAVAVKGNQEREVHGRA